MTQTTRPAPPSSDELVGKARVLMEALPYIKRWSGAVFVLKYGGAAMTEPALQRSFVADVVLLHYVGIRPVIVHGGGPQISDMMRRLQTEPRFVGGYRYTGEQELDIVRMVLQKTNKDLVAFINAHGDLSVGISGEDGNLVRVRRMEGMQDGRPVDLGFVGEVERVDPRVVLAQLDAGFIPVVAPIGVDTVGQPYNVNADHVGGAVAAALGAEKLVYLTDVEGLYEDFGDAGSLLSRVGVSDLRRLLDGDRLSSGMIPKVRAIVDALEAGVRRAHILDGRVEHAVLLEIFTDSGVGTMVEAT